MRSLLLSTRAQPDVSIDKGHSDLLHAYRAGHIGWSRRLLRLVQIFAAEYLFVGTPLKVAIRRGHTNVTDLLLENTRKGRSVNSTYA